VVVVAADGESAMARVAGAGFGRAVAMPAPAGFGRWVALQGWGGAREVPA
jgi:hypothetical protein